MTLAPSRKGKIVLDINAKILSLFRQLTDEQKEKFILLVQVVSLEQQAETSSDQDSISSPNP